MTKLEIIGRLCEISAIQADIINEQAMFIEQVLTVDGEAKKHFADKRKMVEALAIRIESDIQS